MMVLMNKKQLQSRFAFIQMFSIFLLSFFGCLFSVFPISRKKLCFGCHFWNAMVYFYWELIPYYVYTHATTFRIRFSHLPRIVANVEHFLYYILCLCNISQRKKQKIFELKKKRDVKLKVRRESARAKKGPKWRY